MRIPRVAIFPVGGKGTRFLPFTKSVPHELLPLNGKPILEYAINEAMKSGIERFIFVNSPSKQMIEDHFTCTPDLELDLFVQGKHKELTKVIASDLGERLQIVHQEKPLGLGDAIRCARNYIFDEPFAVVLPDDFIHCERPALGQMIEQYRRKPGNYVATHNVGITAIHNYGCLDIGGNFGSTITARGIVEKPDPLDAPSTYAVVGRYILEPEVMRALAKAEPNAEGRFPLADILSSQDQLFGFKFEGSHYDCGQPVGYAAANVFMTTTKTTSRMVTNPLRRSRVSSMPIENMNNAG